MRSGEHRCFVVAKLLERRQSELAYNNQNSNGNWYPIYYYLFLKLNWFKFLIISNFQTILVSIFSNFQFIIYNYFSGNDGTNDNDNDDKNSESDMYMSNQVIGPPLFQNRLFHYLDSSAPKMDNHVEFSNLILLFYELICHDVFSHDAYLCALISR